MGGALLTISDKDFVTRVRMLLCVIPPEQLADDLFVSVPAIKRWERGVNLPRNGMRRQIESYRKREQK